MAQKNSKAISPTAHYTGYTWVHHGLSHPAFATAMGHRLYTGFRPINAVAQWLGGPTVQGVLLARHRGIDFLLSLAIDEQRVSQVIEVAAGLSPRGWRFKQKYGAQLRYIEADLPHMAELKRQLLARSQLQSAGHDIVDFDAMAQTGPLSLDHIASGLDPQRGVAIITEGLLMYLSKPAVHELWSRFARVLSGFPYGMYLSDLHLQGLDHGMLLRSLRPALSALVRGPVRWHHQSAQEARAALSAAGFQDVHVHHPREISGLIKIEPCKGADIVRVVQAFSHPAR